MPVADYLFLCVSVMIQSLAEYLEFLANASNTITGILLRGKYVSKMNRVLSFLIHLLKIYIENFLTIYQRENSERYRIVSFAFHVSPQLKINRVQRHYYNTIIIIVIINNNIFAFIKIFICLSHKYNFD